MHIQKMLFVLIFGFEEPKMIMSTCFCDYSRFRFTQHKLYTAVCLSSLVCVSAPKQTPTNELNLTYEVHQTSFVCPGDGPFNRY